MSYQSAKWKRLGTDEGVFSKGYIDNTQNLYQNDSSSPFLRNARLKGNSVEIRPGHQLLSELTSGDYPRGIGAYTTSNVLIVRHNESGTEKLVQVEEDGTSTAITTGANITSDNRMFFQNIGSVLYCMNGVDNFGKLDGTTYTTPTTGLTNFAPSFSVVFNSSHWASGWSANSNTIYKSVGDNYEDFNGTGSDSFTFEEAITGLEATTESLFYFTSNSISVTTTGDISNTGGTIYYNTRKLNVKEGALNNACIVARGPEVYFVTPSFKIQKLARGVNVEGFETIQLSHRKYAGIETILSTLDSDQSEAFGYYLEDKNLIKWFFKTSGASFNDICVVYDLTKDAWLIDEQKYFYDATLLNGKNYSVSMIESKVYQDEYSWDDEGTPISFEYWTKEFYLSDPTYKKIIWESRTLLDINELAEITQSIYVDGGEIDSKTITYSGINAGGIGTSPVGTFAVGTGGGDDTDEMQERVILRTKGNLNEIGKKFQWRFTCDSFAARILLKDIQALFETKPPITTNL